jgi:hypothetical protein
VARRRAPRRSRRGYMRSGDPQRPLITLARLPSPRRRGRVRRHPGRRLQPRRDTWLVGLRRSQARCGLRAWPAAGRVVRGTIPSAADGLAPGSGCPVTRRTPVGTQCADRKRVTGAEITDVVIRTRTGRCRHTWPSLTARAVAGRRCGARPLAAVALAGGHGYSVSSTNYGGCPASAEQALWGGCPVAGSYGRKDRSPMGRSTAERLERALTALDVDYDVRSTRTRGRRASRGRKKMAMPLARATA